MSATQIDQMLEQIRGALEAERSAYLARVTPAWQRLRDLGGTGRMGPLAIEVVDRPGDFRTSVAEPDLHTSPEADAAAADLDRLAREPTPVWRSASELYEGLRRLLWPRR